MKPIREQIESGVHISLPDGLFKNHAVCSKSVLNILMIARRDPAMLSFENLMTTTRVTARAAAVVKMLAEPSSADQSRPKLSQIHGMHGE